MSWQKVSLAEISDKPMYGAIAKGSKVPFGPLFVRQTDITTGRIDWSTVPYCDLSEKKLEKYKLRRGDLLISRLGNGVGNAATVIEDRDDAVFAGYLVRFRPREEIADPMFVGYALQSNSWKQHVLGFRSGAAQPTLNAQQMGEFSFLLPPLADQRRIAASLSTIDDKITQNLRIISVMEELGAAYLERSVDSDAQGRMNFDSERRLGDILVELETGSRPRGGLKPGAEGVISLGAQHVQSAGICTQTNFGHVPAEFVATMKRGVLKDGDVLVYKDGGKPGNFIPHISAFGMGFPVDEAVINEHVYRVRSNSTVSQGLLYWMLRSPWMDIEMRLRGTGVAIPGLNSSNFRDLPIPSNLESVAAELNLVLDSLLSSILRYGAENRRLSALRDVLLPELLSGRIRVPVEGATA